jgi:tRNA 2-selenouridine synthase
MCWPVAGRTTGAGCDQGWTARRGRSSTASCVARPAAARRASSLNLSVRACHRGSLLGDLPAQPQPTQKWFDSQLLDAMRRFDTRRVIWVEAESKRIGNIQLPDALFEAMHAAPVVNLDVPMAERVRLWREDYAHFAADPNGMVDKLEPLKPLVGKQVLDEWRALARTGAIDALFESVMVQHYDPCYARSSRRHYGERVDSQPLLLSSLDPAALSQAVERLVGA